VSTGIVAAVVGGDDMSRRGCTSSTAVTVEQLSLALECDIDDPTKTVNAASKEIPLDQ